MAPQRGDPDAHDRRRIPANPRVASPDAAGMLLYGAAGGSLMGLLALAAASAGLVAQGRAPVAALNLLAAWSVRWLQTAAPQAFDNVYLDGTLVGLALAVVGGAVLGSAMAGVMQHFQDDHPVVWGVVLAVGTWAAARWALGPALNPRFVQLLGPWLAVACLGFGTGVGLWVHAGRRLMGEIETEPAAVIGG